MELPWHQSVVTTHFSGKGWKVTHPSETVSEARYSKAGKNKLLVRIAQSGRGYVGAVIPSHNSNVIGIEIGTRGGVRPPAARWVSYDAPSHQEQAESIAKKLSDLIKGR